MSRITLSPGLHVISRPKSLVRHIAIVDVGNSIGAINFGPFPVRTLDFAPSGFRFDPYREADGWRFERTLADVPRAVSRFWYWRRHGDLRYDAVLNNCEHFVSVVADGQRCSPQAQAAAAAALVVLTIAIAAHSRTFVHKEWHMANYHVTNPKGSEQWRVVKDNADRASAVAPT